MKDRSPFYWDTSALLTLAFAEPQTRKVRAFVEDNKALPAYTSFITLIEMESALERRIAEGSLRGGLPDTRIALKTIESGLTLIWPEQGLVSLARRCVMEYSLRAGDAIQLASALELATEYPQVTFVCLDDRLSRASVAAQLIQAF